MGFLIRIALFLGLVILFIPADEAETKKLANGQSLSLFDTLGFASAAYSDVRGFCERNPQACSTGGILVATFEAKARTGARWVYSYLEPSAAQTKAEPNAPAAQPVQPLATGSVNTRPSRVQPMPDAVTTVSVQRRSTSNFLPLPPARRPS
jgi:hypothetical protein